MDKATIDHLYDVYRRTYSVTTDSRKVKAGQIYFSLKGERFDGNAYAKGALEDGASLAIVDDESVVVHGDDRYILVENGLKTLQDLARHHRQVLNIPVIALTGSNGKTTTKELLAACLKTKYKLQFTKGNLNNHIGVPLTILSTLPNHELLLVEMGANHIGEIKDLCEIAMPDIGLITNIGRAHLEGFGSYEGVIRAKTEMYKYLMARGHKLVLNGEDQLLVDQCGSYENTSAYYPSEYKVLDSFPFLQIEKAGLKLNTSLVGAYNVFNIAAALHIGGLMECESDKMFEAIASYAPSNNRSQLVEKDGNQYIADAYNANPSSMQLNIEAFGHNLHDQKILVLGDMLELGGEAKTEHQKVLELINKFNWTKVILVGPLFGQMQSSYGQYEFVNTAKEAKDRLSQISDSIIFVKGSRGIGLEVLFN